MPKKWRTLLQQKNNITPLATVEHKSKILDFFRLLRLRNFESWLVFQACVCPGQLDSNWTPSCLLHCTADRTCQVRQDYIVHSLEPWKQPMLLISAVLIGLNSIFGVWIGETSTPNHLNAFNSIWAAAEFPPSQLNSHLQSVTLHFALRHHCDANFLAWLCHYVPKASVSASLANCQMQIDATTRQDLICKHLVRGFMTGWIRTNAHHIIFRLTEGLMIQWAK